MIKEEVVKDTKVIILVPIYNTGLNPLEEISLYQVFSILGEQYKICFVIPDNVQFSFLMEPDCVEKFDSRFFKSTESYSELLLSVEFYQRFAAYEFMLIYQLDAFVFSNRLQEFCSLDYDYIGAPTPRQYWGFLKKRVGNGGFSLRRVSAFIKLLNHKDEILLMAQQNLSRKEIHILLSVEDQFWAYCSTISKFDFKIPSINIAKKFSVEYDIGHVYRDLANHLPFGCHRWYSDNFDVWWPIIQQYGYALSSSIKNQFTGIGHYKKARKVYLCKYLLRRIIRADDKERIRAYCSVYLDLDSSYSIWGYGNIGRQCFHLLNSAGIKVSSIYDSNIRGKQEKNIPVLYPHEALLLQKTSKILISTTKYQNEIQKKLEALGLEQGKDYYIFAELVHKICWGIIHKIGRRSLLEPEAEMGVVIFGTGTVFERQRENIDLSEIVCFIDNDKKKQHTQLYGRDILSLSELQGISYSQVVIFSTKYYQEMYQQLIDSFVPADRIVSWYAFTGTMKLFLKRRQAISSSRLPEGLADVMRAKGLCRLLDMGERLPVYSVLNHQDRRFQHIYYHFSVDSYAREHLQNIGVPYNLYTHRYTEKAEILSQHYDAVVYLDAFLYMDVEACKRSIEMTLELSEYVAINIPYGDDYAGWSESTFSAFGETEVYRYYDMQFLVIKKQRKKRTFCRLFVVTHKDFSPPKDSLYVPVRAGAAGNDTFGYMGDDTGENISGLNPWINECTALYWMWKHADSEYVGLQHYRRYFIKNAEQWTMDNILDEDIIRKYMQSYDVLVAEASQSYPHYRVYQIITEHVVQGAYVKGLEIVRALMSERQPAYVSTFDAVMHGWSFYPCNMFVMKKAVMDVYCEWLFSFLIDAAKQLDIRSYDAYSQRIIGFLAERMLTVWLMHHQLKIRECPVLLLS